MERRDFVLGLGAVTAESLVANEGVRRVGAAGNSALRVIAGIHIVDTRIAKAADDLSLQRLCYLRCWRSGEARVQPRRFGPRILRSSAAIAVRQHPPRSGGSSLIATRARHRHNVLTGFPAAIRRMQRSDGGRNRPLGGQSLSQLLTDQPPVLERAAAARLTREVGRPRTAGLAPARPLVVGVDDLVDALGYFPLVWP